MLKYFVFIFDWILCTFQTHLPGYIEDYDKLKAKGVELIACISVNDAFVMEAWGEATGATGKVRIVHKAVWSKQERITF